MKRTLTEHQVEVTIGNLLRAGVIAAGITVFIGGILYLIRHGAQIPEYRVFRGEQVDIRGVGGILKNVLSLKGRSIIQMGLLILIATPIARVAFSVYAFAREGDRIYIVVTLIVLSILIYSLLGGRL